MSQFIKFKKTAYKNDSLEIYLYGILKTLENRAGFTMVSIKQLLEFSDLGRSAAHKIEQALTNLIQQQVIDVYDAVDFQNNVDISNVKSSDILYIKVNEIVTEKEPFVQIYTDEILKFMSTKMKGTKTDIFKQFLYLMGFVNQGKEYRKISFPSIETIVKDTGVSDRTVKSHTKTLEEHGFLYSNILVIGKEKVKKIYSRPQHVQDVEDAIAEAIANNTKEINIKKGFRKESVSSEVHEDKEFKSTLKKPELMLEVDEQIRDVFVKYHGELNDQSLSKLKQFQEQHGVEVLIRAIHISMDGKKGLKNPTGFMLGQLKEGKVIEDAKYQIRWAKENLERMQRKDSISAVPKIDYVEAWRKKKEKEKEEEKDTGDISHDIEDFFGVML
jgi:DNA-binding transcriptional ArsR family regulator